MNGGPGGGKVIRIAPALSTLAERTQDIKNALMKKGRVVDEGAFNLHG
jgi:hypothetical protein